MRARRHVVKEPMPVRFVAEPVAPAAASVASTAVLDQETIREHLVLAGAWTVDDRRRGRAGGLATMAGEGGYSSLVATYIPPELRLLPIMESLSQDPSSAMADFALGYTFSAFRQDPSGEDDRSVYLQLLLRPPSSASLPGDLGRTKPGVGGRFFVDLAQRWSVALRADAEGFRLSGASDLSWNLVGSIGRDVTDLLEVRLGYRISRLDSRQSGTETLGIKRLVQGPQLGFVLHF